MNSIADLPSERQCHKQLFRLVWGDVVCPNCGEKLKFTDKYAWCGECRTKHRVRSETWFACSKLSFRQIWLIVWCWQKKKSVGAIKDIVGVSYTTVKRWLIRFRQSLPESDAVLSGKTEVDESFFGKRKFGGQTLVVGAIERSPSELGTRRVRLAITPNRTRETLERFMQETVQVGSRIDTDFLPSYNELHLLGYEHSAHNHDKGDFGATNQIESLWSAIKRHIRTLYGGRQITTNLHLLLKEWENRQNNPSLFYNVDNYLFSRACSGLVE